MMNDHLNWFAIIWAMLAVAGVFGFLGGLEGAFLHIFDVQNWWIVKKWKRDNKRRRN